MITQALSLLILLGALGAPALACEEESPAHAAAIEPAAAVAALPSDSVRKANLVETGAGAVDERYDEFRLEPDPADIEIWWRRYQRDLAHAHPQGSDAEFPR